MWSRGESGGAAPGSASSGGNEGPREVRGGWPAQMREGCRGARRPPVGLRQPPAPPLTSLGSGSSAPPQHGLSAHPQQCTRQQAVGSGQRCPLEEPVVGVLGADPASCRVGTPRVSTLSSAQRNQGRGEKPLEWPGPRRASTVGLAERNPVSGPGLVSGAAIPWNCGPVHCALCPDGGACGLRCRPDPIKCPRPDERL